MEQTISGGGLGGLNPQGGSSGVMYDEDICLKMPDPLGHFPDLSIVKKEDLFLVVCILE